MRDRMGIIIQAYMGSKRLPGKILKMIGNKALLEHIFFRLTYLKHNAKIVLATSDSPADDVVEELCVRRNIDCFRGSQDNVIERYYSCAKKYGFSNIIRLTGDNPFVDIEELDRLISLHFQADADFSHSFESLPLGVGAEIFTFSVLEKSYLEGKYPHHLEHVDEYMLENPTIFKTSILTASPDKNRHDVRLTVDTEDDYKKACYIVENSGKEFITTQEAIRLSEGFLNKESGI